MGVILTTFLHRGKAQGARIGVIERCRARLDGDPLGEIALQGEGGDVSGGRPDTRFEQDFAQSGGIEGASWNSTTPSLPASRRGSRAERKRSHSGSRTSGGMDSE